MQRLALLILAAGVLAGPAAAQQSAQENARGTFDFERHDTNDDGYLTEAEWEDAGNAAGEFANIDKNGDGYLEEHEIFARNDRSNLQDAGMDAGEPTPEEDYLGTGQDPLAADPADNEPISQETEAAAAGGVDLDARSEAGENSTARTSPIDNSLFVTREGDAEQSLSRLDSSGDGRVSRQEAEQDEEARQKFVAWDTNQDGYLEQAEIRAGRAQQDDEEQQRDISFDEDDVDGDGRITRDETEDPAEFDTFDANSDGYLDPAEVRYEPGERTVADAAGFQDLDTDSDDRLSRSEAANDPYIDANFESWDSDQDGYLEEEEVNNGWLEESSATRDEIW